MLLRTQDAVWCADRASLDETHRALTGHPFPATLTDAAARVRITMLMLAARDYAGPDENPVDAVIQKGIQMKNAYPAGTLLRHLADEIEERTEPRSPATEKVTRRKFTRIRATGRGTSKMQAGSDRYRVYCAIQAAGGAGITYAELDEKLGLVSRGHVQKLIDKDHVEPIYEDQQP